MASDCVSGGRYGAGAKRSMNMDEMSRIVWKIRVVRSHARRRTPRGNVLLAPSPEKKGLMTVH